MHQIRFRLGLRPRPRWGSLQRSPRPSSWISRGLILRGRDGRKGERRGGEKGRQKGKGKILRGRDGRKGERRGGEKGRQKGKGKEEEKEGRERKGREREWTPQGFSEMTLLL